MRALLQSSRPILDRRWARTTVIVFGVQVAGGRPSGFEVEGVLDVSIQDAEFFTPLPEAP